MRRENLLWRLVVKDCDSVIADEKCGSEKMVERDVQDGS